MRGEGKLLPLSSSGREHLPGCHALSHSVLHKSPTASSYWSSSPSNSSFSSSFSFFSMFSSDETDIAVAVEC